MRILSRTEFRILLVSILAGISVYGYAAPKADTCLANKNWVLNPTLPVEVGSTKTGENDFCPFYQFSWQAFLYMMSPQASTSIKPDSANPLKSRNFQNAEAYPNLLGKKKNKQLNSCAKSGTGNTLFIRTKKSISANGDSFSTDAIHQAGDSAVIYDQNGNVVFYDVRFSRKLCDLKSIQSKKVYPSGTTEMKAAWRIILESEKNNYFWINADIDDGTKVTTEILGLIGFHMAIATAMHPEFIWATFEHKGNSPDCISSSTAMASTTSFASATCTNALKNKNSRDTVNLINCQFNSASSSPTSITNGTPTNICREYVNGTGATDEHAGENNLDIDTLNAQVSGPDGILSQADTPADMKVWANYFIVGALWVSNVAQPSNNIATGKLLVPNNQRGSLRLANTVAETTFQNVDLHANFVSNCFGCHSYVGTDKYNTSPNASLSHIFDDIIDGQCKKVKQVKVTRDTSETVDTQCMQTCTAGTYAGWNGTSSNLKGGKINCSCC